MRKILTIGEAVVVIGLGVIGQLTIYYSPFTQVILLIPGECGNLMNKLIIKVLVNSSYEYTN